LEVGGIGVDGRAVVVPHELMLVDCPFDRSGRVAQAAGPKSECVEPRERTPGKDLVGGQVGQGEAIVGGVFVASIQRRHRRPQGLDRPHRSRSMSITPAG
jgi:hypothetical protein